MNARLTRHSALWAWLVLAPAVAFAQEPTAPPALDPPDAEESGAPGANRPPLTARVHGLAGFQSFTAKDSFEAVLDTSGGPVFGAGGGLLLGRNVFVDVLVSRFSADGSRVFVTDTGDRFDLGIPTTVRVVPLDVSIGWRFTGRPRLNARGKPLFRPVPFGGGGFGFVNYEETSEGSQSGEDVSERHGSYHVLGGVELPFSAHLGASVGALYRWVPDALGTNGVSQVFGEDDLGGLQVRVLVTWTF